MPQPVEEIPESLRDAVAAGVAWLDARDARNYSVSGILDPEPTQAQRSGGASSLDLRLVVCSGDLCLREDLKLRPAAQGFEVSGAASDADPPGELDPKPGVRGDWLAEKLAAHAFVLLIFYRGFW